MLRISLSNSEFLETGKQQVQFLKLSMLRGTWRTSYQVITKFSRPQVPWFPAQGLLHLSAPAILVRKCIKEFTLTCLQIIYVDKIYLNPVFTHASDNEKFIINDTSSLMSPGFWQSIIWEERKEKRSIFWKIFLNIFFWLKLKGTLSCLNWDTGVSFWKNLKQLADKGGSLCNYVS